MKPPPNHGVSGERDNCPVKRYIGEHCFVRLSDAEHPSQAMSTLVSSCGKCSGRFEVDLLTWVIAEIVPER